MLLRSPLLIAHADGSTLAAVRLDVDGLEDATFHDAHGLAAVLPWWERFEGRTPYVTTWDAEQRDVCVRLGLPALRWAPLVAERCGVLPVGGGSALDRARAVASALVSRLRAVAVL
jgi:hypothetical protein